MQNVHTENGKFKAERLVIHYPAGRHTVQFNPDCPVNGNAFLRELLNFGWVPGDLIGRTLHLLHPAAPYSEA